MTLLATMMITMLAAAGADISPAVVQAPDSPVRLDHAKVLNVGAAEPAVLMYAATNLTDNDLEQFTVIAFIFDADGVLKTRQVAPGRRTLEKRSTKYSTMVLDGRSVTATDRIVIGVNQVQRTDSDKWWAAELEEAAQAAVKKAKAGSLNTPRPSTAMQRRPRTRGESIPAIQ
jgi:hypothetical protein